MTRNQAVARLKRLYGQNLTYRVSEHGSSPEARAAARELKRQARERIAAIDAEIAERLKALDWFQALHAEKRQLRQTENQATGDMLHYKFSIGKRLDSMFSTTTGHGDTWEEAFAMAEAKESGNLSQRGDEAAGTERRADGIRGLAEGSRGDSTTAMDVATDDGESVQRDARSTPPD